MSWRRILGLCSARLRLRRIHRPVAVIAMVLVAALLASMACSRSPAAAPTAEPSSPGATAADEQTAAPKATATRPTQSEPTRLGMPAVIAQTQMWDIPAPGQSPSALVQVGDSLYVANRESDNVSVLSKGRVASVVPVGQEPASIAVHAPSRRVFVANERDATISVLEGTRSVDTWEAPDVPTCLAVVGDELWVGTNSGGQITVRSVADGTRVGAIALSTDYGVLGLSIASPDEVIATTYGRVHVIDVETRQESVAADCGCYRALAVAPDGEAYYVTAYDSDAGQTYVLALDASNLEIIRRAPVPSDPADIVVDPLSGRLYIASSWADEVTCMSPDLDPVATVSVGPSPRALSLDSDAGTLYVANREGDSVSLIDVDQLSHLDTVPLSGHTPAMAWDATEQALYVAMASADRIARIDSSGERVTWFVPGYPTEVLPLPGEETVAVLCSVANQIRLYSGEGELLHSYPTSRHPAGLAFDAASRTLYGGDLAVDLATERSRPIAIETLYESSTPPVQVVADTLRETLYGVAYNGIPGSNGGYIVYPLDSESAAQTLGMPGRLSVVDLVYSSDVERFFSTNARMGTYGVQMWDPETRVELLYVTLPAYPSAIAANRSTHHLWVALATTSMSVGPHDRTLLLCLDTRTMGLAATLEVEGVVESLALDYDANRLFAACGDSGIVHTVADVALPAPPAPTVTPTWAPQATPVPTLTPTALATPTRRSAATLSPTPCAWKVDEQVQPVWASLGGTEGLGCPGAPAIHSDLASQAFEHGEMIWRAADMTILVLVEDGSFYLVKDTWQEGMPSDICADDPPSGKYHPVRGFGRVWCHEPNVKALLGWGLDEEQPMTGGYQAFQGGELLVTDTGWRVLGADGRWYGSP